MRDRSNLGEEGRLAFRVCMGVESYVRDKALMQAGLGSAVLELLGRQRRADGPCLAKAACLVGGWLKWALLLMGLAYVRSFLGPEFRPETGSMVGLQNGLCWAQQKMGSNEPGP